MNGRPLLVTRAQPGADATVAAARALGLDPRLYPLFAVRALPWQAPDPQDFDALMLTSAQTLRHGGPALHRFRALPAACVGAATARAARAAGFAPLPTPGRDAQALIAMLAQAGHRHILHPGGADVRPYDAGTLSVQRIPVYRAEESGDAAGLAAHLAGAPVLLAHSPRGAARLAALLAPSRRASLTLVGLSPAVLAAAGPHWAARHAPDTPTDAAMLALARQICHSPPSIP